MPKARWLGLLVAAAGAAFLAVGFVGIDRYGRNYWLYRGFPPPHDPAWVTARGSVQHIKVASAALGGRSQDVYVYLPPSYGRDTTRRYPVAYYLHGLSGSETDWLSRGAIDAVADSLFARGTTACR